MIILRMHQEFLSYIFPLSIHNRQTFLQLIFLFFTLFGSYDLIAQEKTFVVVLDAGHGGHDSGNRGNGYYEKKIALNIALTATSVLPNPTSPQTNLSIGFSLSISDFISFTAVI